MIRVNLLKNRQEPVDGLEAAIAVTGPSAFINRREIFLGALFLALGAGILYVNSVVAGPSDADTARAASASESVATATEPAVTIEPAPRETVAAPEPPPAIASQPAAGMAPDAIAAPPLAQPPSQREATRATPVVTLAVPTPLEPRAQRSVSRPAPRPAEAGVPTTPRPDTSEHVPGELSSLDVSNHGPALHILATIGKQPAYQMFRLNSPNRVVVDLSGVTLALPASQRQITPSHPLVERIRIAQFQVSPPTVRMVFDVLEFPKVSIQPVPAGLTFQVAAPAP